MFLYVYREIKFYIISLFIDWFYYNQEFGEKYFGIKYTDNVKFKTNRKESYLYTKNKIIVKILTRIFGVEIPITAEFHKKMLTLSPLCTFLSKIRTIFKLFNI